MDKKARKILFEYFWSSSGWKPETSRHLSPEDFEYAKTHGAMYDPISVAHDPLIQRAQAAVNAVSKGKVASAFVASLARRCLDVRSSISSYALLMNLPNHLQSPTEYSPNQCSICGVFVKQSEYLEDISILSFERHKWGGVRLDQILYATLDLEWFVQSAEVDPTDADVSLLSSMLDAIRRLPANVSAASLETHLKFLPSNKSERDVLIAILGIAGILETPDHPGYVSGFRNYVDRVSPNRRFVDMTYPACWWESKYGLNERAVEYWFGNVLKGPNHSLEGRRP